jgi:hypothetical protein
LGQLFAREVGSALAQFVAGVVENPKHDLRLLLADPTGHLHEVRVPLALLPRASDRIEDHLARTFPWLEWEGPRVDRVADRYDPVVPRVPEHGGCELAVGDQRVGLREGGRPL